MSKLSEQIRKFVLANAFSHGGKAQTGAIIGKLIGAGTITKANITKTKPIIDKTIKEINKLSLKDQEAELKKIYPKFFEERPAEEKTVPKLPKSWISKVVTRFEPSPSGPMHIGHAYTLASNLELARQYKGKCIIRVSDTNPDNIHPPAYQMLKDDSKWLSNGFIKNKDFYLQSKRLETYYKYAEKAILIGIAYVCTCKPESWREDMLAKRACPCRNLLPPENLRRWKHMLGLEDRSQGRVQKGGLAPCWKTGAAVVRIKTDLKHKNPAMRDWPALRINTHRHPLEPKSRGKGHRKRHRVWPLMNFAVAIDDHEMGITHTFRAKEHRDNAKRQQYLYDAFGWQMPQHWYLGAINFIGLKLSTTKTRQAIEAGEYDGWDDVRLPSLTALKRRGYQPAALIKYGLAAASETDKTVQADEFFKMIDKFNREVIDATSNRYFFIADPTELKLKGKVPKEVKLKTHPDKQATRTIKVSGTIYIEKADFQKYKNKNVRLKGLGNFTLKKTLKPAKEIDTQTIHWASKPNTSVQVLMPNNKWVKGLGEPLIKEIKPGKIVQFERFGFARCEKRNRFIFAHK